MVNRDEEHLNLLALYHWVVAAIMALILFVFVLLPLVLGPGYLAALHVAVPAGGKQAMQLRLISGLLVGGMATLVFALNGWSLKKRQYYICCIILSCIECLSIPLGMILGVSAILVLRRESVKAMFHHNRLSNNTSQNAH
jgi:hypothetical protein